MGIPEFIGLKTICGRLMILILAVLKNNVVIIVVLTTIPTISRSFWLFLFQFVAVKVGKTTANLLKPAFIYHKYSGGNYWRNMEMDFDRTGVPSMLFWKNQLGSLAQNWLGDPACFGGRSCGYGLVSDRLSALFSCPLCSGSIPNLNRPVLTGPRATDVSRSAFD